MRQRGYVTERKGLWGRATVYADFVCIHPDVKWCRKMLSIVRRGLRGRKLRDYDYDANWRKVARKALSLAVLGLWRLESGLTSEGHVLAYTDKGVDTILKFQINPWPITTAQIWFERTHDGKEGHFVLEHVLAAQELYDNNDILPLKMWTVDALAKDQVHFARHLSKCVSEKAPSSQLMQPMDIFAFWAEDGNIFAHTAFGEKVRLFKADDTSMQKRHGWVIWDDFPKHARSDTLSTLRTYF